MRIVFCTPFGGRSGSELLLWHLLTQTQGKVSAVLYSEQAAELAAQLPPSIPYYSNPFGGSGFKTKWSKLQNAFGIPVYRNFFERLQQIHQPDVWYLNTVMMAHLAPLLHSMGAKYVSHFHELPHIHFEPVKYPDLRAMVQQAEAVIGNTQTTCEVLRTMGATDPKLVYPFVDTASIQPDYSKAAEIRSQLGIPKSAFVWVSIGAATFAKGIEYLPQVAKRFPECHFLWIGKHTNSGSFFYTESLIKSLGLTNVHFVGSQHQAYYDYFAAANALLLLSKEESFGMVNIEAAHLGIPVVSFNSGGVVEVIKEGSGVVVDSWNVCDLAAAMSQTMNRAIGFDPRRALANVEEFSYERQVARWLRVMQDAVKSTP